MKQTQLCKILFMDVLDQFLISRIMPSMARAEILCVQMLREPFNL